MHFHLQLMQLNPCTLHSAHCIQSVCLYNWQAEASQLSLTTGAIYRVNEGPKTRLDLSCGSRVLVPITEFIATPGSSSKVTSSLAEVSTVSELISGFGSHLFTQNSDDGVVDVGGVSLSLTDVTRNRPRHVFVVSIIYSVEQSLTITCTNYEVTDVHEVVLMIKCSTLISCY